MNGGECAMKIIDVQLCDVKEDMEKPEYRPLSNDKPYRVQITRHNLGMQFVVECNTDEYYWMFGDKRPNKLSNVFETALCIFIKECFEDEEEETENE